MFTPTYMLNRDILTCSINLFSTDVQNYFKSIVWKICTVHIRFIWSGCLCREQMCSWDLWVTKVIWWVSNLLLSNLRDHLRPTLQALQGVLSCSRLSSNRRRLAWPGRRARSSSWSCGCCGSSSSSSLPDGGSLKTNNLKHFKVNSKICHLKRPLHLLF